MGLSNGSSKYGGPPAVGVAVFVRRRGRILMGRRCSERGKGRWSIPGGHLEPGETFEQCARRETREEAGVEIKNLTIRSVTNDLIWYESAHYVTVIVVADYWRGTVELKEPDAFDVWDWCDWHHPPQPLTEFLKTLRSNSFNPFEKGETIQLDLPLFLGRSSPQKKAKKCEGLSPPISIVVKDQLIPHLIRLMGGGSLALARPGRGSHIPTFG